MAESEEMVLGQALFPLVEPKKVRSIMAQQLALIKAAGLQSESSSSTNTSPSVESNQTILEQVRAIQRVRETILKTCAFCGFPKSITAMAYCMEAVDPELQQLLSKSSMRGFKPHQDEATYLRETIESGQRFFDRVYKHRAEKVASDLKKYYPDLAEVAVNDIYGRILSPEHILNGIETELIAVGSIAVQNTPTVLKGHMIGAANVGATQAQIQAVLRLAKRICP
ncbi:hypothetical protein H4R33_006387 [Dimargaris cristalligena]|uniref:Carboxymuconolactone decarboxylase-like domain-containing protein n=1 Tax=Dimargaris cristalligena TaxID=215637 RepID=A0A4Q0A0C8_9FUNG|nr:hypothetical protein H4R33_006387 [Dimargaris cristalligena]RKP39536.1 hypothetical protein BJ085DRAFT_38269 [Dimargaris cristalligena]|eukprot:RKP39536.1 hypothetical protein BJ085DRAFT_38269 [Dimargaris cristalligena]